MTLWEMVCLIQVREVLLPKFCYVSNTYNMDDAILPKRRLQLVT